MYGKELKMTATVQVRVDAGIKKAAEQIYADLGMDLSTALRMFLKATIRE
jgi:DNA-damage-inducible protein J